MPKQHENFILLSASQRCFLSFAKIPISSLSAQFHWSSIRATIIGYENGQDSRDDVAFITAAATHNNICDDDNKYAFRQSLNLRQLSHSE